MKRHTKIVCTLGPAVDSRQKIKALIDAGMNVARLNASHGDWESRGKWASWVRELSPELGRVGIIADLQGPKFRIGEIQNGMIEVRTGDSLRIGRGSDATIPVLADEIYSHMAPGDRILLGDGDVELKLGPKTGDAFECKALSGGKIKTKQGLTIVGKSFEVPAITEKDIQDVYEAAKIGVDYIALSYVRKAADMRELRRLVDKYDPTIKLCAKIENREALKNIDEIIKVSDVIMVARGDLGLQMDIEEVPLAQKQIIAHCLRAGRPVITATQMLESMVNAARPTRAEATDVANAIFDGTDAVMLSGETAMGQYPVEAVRMMARIAERTETQLDYESRLDDHSLRAVGQSASTEAVAHAAAYLATLLRVKAIVTTTASGQTPRLVSKFRPRAPIYCAAWNPKTQAQMSVVWGVQALTVAVPKTTDDVVGNAIDAFLREKRLKVGDKVVVTSGVPAGTPGHTNLILVEEVK